MKSCNACKTLRSFIIVVVLKLCLFLPLIDIGTDAFTIKPSHQFSGPGVSLISGTILRDDIISKLTKANFFPCKIYPSSSSSTALYYERDADMMEMYAGGQRYEMVDLPDSMVDTTIFVGNLCEFVTDEMLSSLFQEVTCLSSVPACVVRKPNMASLRYGFVTFPTVEEKENAIIRFSGYILNNKPIKVEEIQDYKGTVRVRVPESIVSYTVGASKRTRDGSKNTLRMARTTRKDKRAKLPHGGKKRKNQFNKRKKYRSKDAKTLGLNDAQRADLERALSRGYLTYQIGRRSVSNATSHRPGAVYRQWCTSRGKPQIILYKSSGDRSVDSLIVDLSPLQIGAVGNMDVVSKYMAKWKTTILAAAGNSGMKINSSLDEETLKCLGIGDSTQLATDKPNEDETCDSPTISSDAVNTSPFIAVGVFQGERSMARAMAKELSKVWELVDENAANSHTGPTRFHNDRRSTRSYRAKGDSKLERRERRRKDNWKS